MIVIKGMDNIMPRHCTECWNCDKNFNSDMPQDKWVCLLLMKFADQSGEKRLDDCPLELVAGEVKNEHKDNGCKIYNLNSR